MSKGPYRTIIQQSEDGYAPPDMDVLEIDLIGDDVILQISKYEEDSLRSTYTSVASVKVTRDQLCHALQLGHVLALIDARR